MCVCVSVLFFVCFSPSPPSGTCDFTFHRTTPMQLCEWPKRTRRLARRTQPNRGHPSSKLSNDRPSPGAFLSSHSHSLSLSLSHSIALYRTSSHNPPVCNIIDRVQYTRTQCPLTTRRLTAPNTRWRSSVCEREREIESVYVRRTLTREKKRERERARARCPAQSCRVATHRCGAPFSFDALSV